jgi:hypothetical protein
VGIQDDPEGLSLFRVLFFRETAEEPWIVGQDGPYTNQNRITVPAEQLLNL